jgi:hypothetical protein
MVDIESDRLIPGDSPNDLLWSIDTGVLLAGITIISLE